MVVVVQIVMFVFDSPVCEDRAIFLYLCTRLSTISSSDRISKCFNTLMYCKQGKNVCIGEIISVSLYR